MCPSELGLLRGGRAPRQLAWRGEGDSLEQKRGMVTVHCGALKQNTEPLPSRSTEVTCVPAERLGNGAEEKIEIMCFLTTQR